MLECHNEPTGGRARVAAQQTGFPVYGSIVLNRAVGGINPVAVAVESDLGARVVWMPTEDSVLHRVAQLPRGPAAQRVVGAAPVRLAPSAPDTRDSLSEVLQLIADADAVLATGLTPAGHDPFTTRRGREMRRRPARVVLRRRPPGPSPTARRPRAARGCPRRGRARSRLAARCGIECPQPARGPLSTEPARCGVALAQFDSSLGDIEGNLARIAELVAEAEAAGADLVVFPEPATHIADYGTSRCSPRAAWHWSTGRSTGSSTPAVTPDRGGGGPGRIAPRLSATPPPPKPTVVPVQLEDRTDEQVGASEVLAAAPAPLLRSGRPRFPSRRRVRHGWTATAASARSGTGCAMCSSN